MSEMLEKARKYEREESAKIEKENRPVFHFSNPVGWMNDPNGFSESGESIIYSFNITLMQPIGIPCIGGVQKVRILSNGSIFRQR